MPEDFSTFYSHPGVEVEIHCRWCGEMDTLSRVVLFVCMRRTIQTSMYMASVTDGAYVKARRDQPEGVNGTLFV